MSRRHKSSKSCCGRGGFFCLKVCAFLFAALYLIVGLLLLATGLWVELFRDSFQSVTYYLMISSFIAIATAVVILISVFLGIWGVVKENVTCLKIYTAVIVFVILIQVVSGVLAFVYRETMFSGTRYALHSSLKTYGKDERIKNAIDKIQSKFVCCGVEGANDWEVNTNFNCTLDGENACGVPDSCCLQRKRKMDCGKEIRHKRMGVWRYSIYTNGCLRVFVDWLKDHLDIIGAVTLATTLLQIVGIILIYVLYSRITERRLLYKYKENQKVYISQDY